MIKQEKTPNNVDSNLINNQSEHDSFTFFSNDEINISKLFDVIWKGKWSIVVITFLFTICSIFYSFSLPSMYKSEGIYAPSQRQSGSGGLAAKYGGLAAIAGINLGGENNDLDQAMALITSWTFLEKVVEKHDLKPLIMAVNGWSPDSKELSWDTDMYDPVSKVWLPDSNGKINEPSSFEVHQEFSSMIKVSKDTTTSMISITIDHFSPYVAESWVKVLVDELNLHFQSRDIYEAKANVEYLEEKIGETGIAEMKSVFYGMIEAQMKTLMLAEVASEYLIKTVVSPKVAEEKSSPQRKLIVLLGFSLGFILALLGLITFNRVWMRKESVNAL